MIGKYGIRFAVLTSLLLVPVSHAQESLNHCKSVLDEKLISQQSSKDVYKVSKSDFEDFCSTQESKSANYRNRSSSFKAGFSDFSSSLNIGSGSALASGFQEEDFDEVCRESSTRFAEFISGSTQASSGTYLAQQFTTCVSILTKAGTPFLTGFIQASGDPSLFTANFDYFRGAGELKVRLTAINGDPIRCYKDNVDLSASHVLEAGHSWVLSGKDSLTCKKPDRQATVAGSFTFAAEGSGITYSVPYEFADSSAQAEIRQSLMDVYNARFSSLEATSRSLNDRLDEILNQLKKELREIVPVNTIAFFRLAECPDGWRRYRKLENRVPIGTSDADRVGRQVGANTVTIPREALPKVALRLPTKGSKDNHWTNAGQPNQGDNGVQATSGGANYDHHVRITEFMGQGDPLVLPLPLGVHFSACIKK